MSAQEPSMYLNKTNLRGPEHHPLPCWDLNNQLVQYSNGSSLNGLRFRSWLKYQTKSPLCSLCCVTDRLNTEPKVHYSSRDLNILSFESPLYFFQW